MTPTTIVSDFKKWWKTEFPDEPLQAQKSTERASHSRRFDLFHPTNPLDATSSSQQVGVFIIIYDFTARTTVDVVITNNLPHLEDVEDWLVSQGFSSPKYKDLHSILYRKTFSKSLQAKLLKKASFTKYDFLKELKKFILEIESDPEISKQVQSQTYDDIIFYPTSRTLAVSSGKVERTIRLNRSLFDYNALTTLAAKACGVSPEGLEPDSCILDWNQGMDDSDVYLGSIYNNQTGKDLLSVHDKSSDADVINFTFYGAEQGPGNIRIYVGKHVRHYEDILDWITVQGGRKKSEDNDDIWFDMNEA